MDRDVIGPAGERPPLPYPTFRERIYGQWGIVDVRKYNSCAEYLERKGEADADRLCIHGCSAGDYTAMASLVFNNTFKSGASLFGAERGIGVREKFPAVSIIGSLTVPSVTLINTCVSQLLITRKTTVLNQGKDPHTHPNTVPALYLQLHASASNQHNPWPLSQILE